MIRVLIKPKFWTLLPSVRSATKIWFETPHFKTV